MRRRLRSGPFTQLVLGVSPNCDFFAAGVESCVMTLGRESTTYELLDFGQGRKLERFGPLVLDRPSPVAEGFSRAKPDAWAAADARFDRGNNREGQWVCRDGLPQAWPCEFGPFRLELKLTPFGHLGVFPEQVELWRWIAEQVRDCGTGGGCKVLNLFAYTGGATLAAAAAGASVVHLDAARNVVTWARRNAELSGLANRPIRWIVEDALKFVRREVRRAVRYDALILDPPSYGHGPKGEAWRMEEQLDELLACCAELTGGRPQFLLCTSHTPAFDAATLRERLAVAGFDASRAVAEECFLTSRDGRKLSSGFAVKISDQASAS
jgi:23S rRNA (cytosine1962-C5)-methyltransferase